MNLFRSVPGYKPTPEEVAMTEAFFDMMRMPGWKEVEKIFQEVKDSPLELLDAKALPDVTPQDAGFIKGVRSAVKSIEQKIAFIATIKRG